jgi:uncharacterized membrane protein YfcA
MNKAIQYSLVVIAWVIGAVLAEHYPSPLWIGGAVGLILVMVLLARRDLKKKEDSKAPPPFIPLSK